MTPEEMIKLIEKAFAAAISYTSIQNQFTHEIGGVEKKGKFVCVNGRYMSMAFREEEIEKHRKNIDMVLQQVTDTLKKRVGNSFFLHFDKDGKPWTADDTVVDHLMSLGLAMGFLYYARTPIEVTNELGIWPEVQIVLE